MTEAEIERHLVNKVEGMGGEAYKLSTPGRRGIPDRLAIFPNGEVWFVELKRPGRKPDPIQQATIRRLQDLKQNAVFFDSKQQVDNLLTNRGLTK